MADAVNYVEVNGEVLVDLRDDTVTPETLVKGATAHDAAGNVIEGAVAVAGYATYETAGIVKPSEDFDIAEDGTLSLYRSIAVTALTLNKNAVYELGTEVNGIQAAWTLNKAAASQMFRVDVGGMVVKSGALAGDIRSTEDVTGWGGYNMIPDNAASWKITVTATDARGAEGARSAAIALYNGVYCGAAAAPETVDSAFVQGLNKSLQGARGRTFTVTAGAGQYIWYACPARYGTPGFSVGGFDGGFSPAATLEYTNPSGYTESYQVWRSDNAGLGATTVTVS